MPNASMEVDESPAGLVVFRMTRTRQGADVTSELHTSQADALRLAIKILQVCGKRELHQEDGDLWRAS